MSKSVERREKIQKVVPGGQGLLMTPENAAATWRGDKGQTRRVIKPSVKGCTVGVYTGGGPTEAVNVQEDGDPWTDIKCPYKVGQVVPIRERHWLYGEWKPNGITDGGRMRWKFHRHSPDVMYHAPGDRMPKWSRGLGWYCRPGVFMARRDARMLVRIDEVRVEQVQDISTEDAKAEGVEKNCLGNWATCPACKREKKCKSFDEYRNYEGSADASPMFNSKDSFRSLWNSINEQLGYGWEVNPWVWAYKYTMQMVISQRERRVLSLLGDREMSFNDLQLAINRRMRRKVRGASKDTIDFMADKGLITTQKEESPGRYRNFPNIETIYSVAEGVRV